MNGVSSFGPNIENILGDILVKRSTIKELLNEIKNISVVNIEKSNSLVEKMLSVVQVINERTNEIEKEYSNFISHKNNFSDLTYWNEKVYPEISSTFENELNDYLKQLMILESICEKYFVQVIEDELANDDQRHLINKNPYNTAVKQNSDIKDNYTYPNSVGYNWYSIKANDDYLTNSKSVLNIAKYDKDKYIETNQINKSSILHETISFHPKYGLVHYLSLGRERTLSPIRDNNNTINPTIEFKTFDGFQGEMNELKSNIDRNIFSNNKTNTTKNDIKYELLMRHNMDSNNGTSYFVLKMRDYESLENGIPSYYFINRNNLDSANITRTYSDTNTSKTLLNPSVKNNNDDIELPDNDTIIKSTTDNDENYTPSKRLSEISTNSDYLNTSYLNIKGKEYNLISRKTIDKDNNFLYSYSNDKPFITFAKISKCNNPTNTNNRDLLSNLKLRIMGYPLIQNNNSNYVSYNGKYDSFKTLNYLDNYHRYQVSHKEFNKYNNITSLERNTYGLSNNEIVYNKTILERRIINNNNQNFDKFTSFTFEESYNLFDNTTKVNDSDYYYENYNKGITLYSSRNDNTALPETIRNLHSNCRESYYDLNDYQIDDTTKQEHSVYIFNNEPSKDNPFNFKTLKSGKWPTNTMITYICANKNHVWALGRNFNEIYYSEDSGLTWNKSTYDKANSTKPYYNLAAVTCNTNCGSCYMLNTGLGIICEYLWNNNTGCYLYTEDFGKTFRTMWAGNDSTSIEFVYINRNGYGLAACRRTSGQQKVHYTRDYGKTWTYTTTTTNINCVYVEDNNDIGYAIQTNSYSGLQKVINLKEGTPTWSNFIPFKDSNNVRTLAMFDFDNYDGILPIMYDGKYPSLFNTKTQSCKNLTSDGLHTGRTVYSSTGFWMDKFGNIFHTQDRDIYINSNSWSNKNGTIKLSMGTEVDTASLGSNLYKPICVLFDEQIILVQSATNRNKIWRIPYGIRNYNVRRRYKYYNCYKQLDISNSKVSSLSEEEYDTIKENVKKELENYYKEKEKLYIGTLSILPYDVVDNEKWLKCDGRKVSKIEYSELYEKLGNIYNNGDEEEGFFRLPDMSNRTILGGKDELIGKTIDDALPNIEFNANFVSNETVFENDKRYGLLGLESSIDDEAIGLMGGLDTVGVNKTKLKIPHNSKSRETIGNMFEVSFYVRAK